MQWVSYLVVVWIRKEGRKVLMESTNFRINQVNKYGNSIKVFIPLMHTSEGTYRGDYCI